MLFEQRFWAGIADGSITVTFRRWKRRQATAGRLHRTSGGLVVVDAVDVVTVADITDDEAVASGYPDAAALVADLRGTPDLPIYRVRFHRFEGPDPRSAESLTPDELVQLRARLARLEARRGPWVRAVLEAIAARPEVPAAELAAGLGRDRESFKLDVRKLKNLGLTLSLPAGYRLSPRGEAYLASLDAPSPGAVSPGLPQRP